MGLKSFYLAVNCHFFFAGLRPAHPAGGHGAPQTPRVRPCSASRSPKRQVRLSAEVTSGRPTSKKTAIYPLSPSLSQLRTKRGARMDAPASPVAFGHARTAQRRITWPSEIVTATPGWLGTIAKAHFSCIAPRRRSHWDPVRATLQQDLQRQPRPPAFTAKLRAAMLVVRATKSREEALDTLNGAGFLSLPRRASQTVSGVLQRFATPVGGLTPGNGPSAAATSATSWCGRCLPCLPAGPPAAPRSAAIQPRPRPPTTLVVHGQAEPLPPGAEKLCGKWCQTTNENGEAYLAEIGLSWSVRTIALSVRTQPTYTIEDGVMHGRTEGLGGQVLHDTFATGVDIPIRMMGYEVLVHYKWEASRPPVLVARVKSLDGKFARGKPIVVRRWIESSTGQLLAESTCGSVTCLRRYDAVPEAKV